MENKIGAMEMSMGTIVTIVLLMTVLILGGFLISKIFTSGTGAIDEIDNAIQNEINKLFAEEGRKLVVYPSSRQIVLKKDDDPKGFAFSVKNDDVENAEFTYSVEAGDISKCGSSFKKETAESYLIGSSGKFSLGPGNSLDIPRLVKFSIPESAPPCTIIYNLEIKKGTDSYSGADIFVVIK